MKEMDDNVSYTTQARLSFLLGLVGLEIDTQFAGKSASFFLVRAGNTCP